MHKTYSLIATITFLLLLVTTAGAQWAPPTTSPPNGNVLPPINTGNTGQVKHGTIGVQLGSTDLVLPAGVGYYTDSSIGVRHYEYVDSNPTWTFNGSDYALDTNAPISVNGVFSTGLIVGTGPVSGTSLSATNLKSSQGDERQVCGQGSDGELVLCTQGVGSSAMVSLSLSPTAIPPGSPTSVTASWQSTADMSSCYALEGPGFSTAGKTNGTDTSNSMTLAMGEVMNFVIVWTDSLGNPKFASAEVVAAINAPEITFSINPNTGGWTNGAFFTTGLSIDPNGGGTLSCRRRVQGASIKANNPWSGQASGIWSSPTSIPPGSAASFNACSGGCQFSDIVTQPNSSAVLTVECSNSGASTANSQWISVGM